MEIVLVPSISYPFTSYRLMSPSCPHLTGKYTVPRPDGMAGKPHFEFS
jgi:hypothetical protein